MNEILKAFKVKPHNGKILRNKCTECYEKIQTLNIISLFIILKLGINVLDS